MTQARFALRAIARLEPERWAEADLRLLVYTIRALARLALGRP